MAIEKVDVPRGTPPLDDLGPLLEVDMDMLEDRLARMNEKDRKKLLDMMDRYAVMIKRTPDE